MVVLVIDRKAERDVLRRVQIARTVVHIPVHARAVVLDLYRPVQPVVCIAHGQAVGVGGLCQQAGSVVVRICCQRFAARGRRKRSAEAVIRQAVRHRTVHVHRRQLIVRICIPDLGVSRRELSYITCGYAAIKVQ